MHISKLAFVLIGLSSFALSSCGKVESQTFKQPKKIEEAYANLFDGVSVNHKPGIYGGNSLVLDFKLDDPNAKLYYSLGGELPLQIESQRFTKPIVVSKTYSNNLNVYPLTTSVDGILPSIDGNRCISGLYNDNIQRTLNYRLFDKQVALTITYVSDTTTYTRSLSYIFNDDPEYYKIPVISLVMPYDDWFGSTNGFYNKIRDDIEKRVNFEFFDPTTDTSLYYNSKIKLGGNWSKGYPQRTLNLNWNKDQNGKKNAPCEYQLFPGRKTCGDNTKEVTNYTRMRLWNAGNSFEADTGFNDAVLQRIMVGTNISTTDIRPTITYLNGEYWGIYYMREHYSDVYFQQHFGLNKDNISVAEYKGEWIYDDGEEHKVLDTLAKIEDFISKKSLLVEDNYQYLIQNYLDVDSFIDVMIAESYAGNWDFVGNNNNLKAWCYAGSKTSNPYSDGKVRFCLHDADFAFLSTNDYIKATSDFSYQSFNLFKQLLKSPYFRAKLYTRAQTLMKENFSALNATRVLDQMITEVRPYKLDHAYRWGWNQNDYKNYWMDCVNYTFDLFKTRGAYYLQDLRSDLGY